MNFISDLYLAYQWIKLHLHYKIFPNVAEFKRLRLLYSESGRFYHTWQHVHDCVKFTQTNYGWQPEVVFGLFYHDAVYDVTRNDNESSSAELWDQYAQRCYLADNIKHIVRQLILATRTHVVDVSSSWVERIMSDADMHIFAMEWDQYKKYTIGVWREYSVFGREEYTKGRLKFLNSVNPHTIFATPQGQAMIDNVYRNIVRERHILQNHPEEILGMS